MKEQNIKEKKIAHVLQPPFRNIAKHYNIETSCFSIWLGYRVNKIKKFITIIYNRILKNSRWWWWWWRIFLTCAIHLQRAVIDFLCELDTFYRVCCFVTGEILSLNAQILISTSGQVSKTTYQIILTCTQYSFVHDQIINCARYFFVYDEIISTRARYILD